MIRSRFVAALAAALAFALSAPSPARAQTEAEIAEVRAALERGADRFLEVIADLDEEQWKFKGAGIAHSLGEEAEHIALSENDLQRVITTALKSEPNAAVAEALDGKEEELEEIMLGEEAAEAYKAPGKIINKAEVTEFFQAAHAKLLRLLESSENLSRHVYKHPKSKIGELTALQWFYYIAYHRERHVRQIEAIMAHPDFPGRVQSAD